MAEVMEEAHKQAGVLLPDVDPTIGEIVIATMQANPGVHPAVLLAALARQAPTNEVAAELVSAGMELLLCRDKGHLVWLSDKAGDVLTGIRRMSTGDGYMVGNAKWPMVALLTGPPVSITIRVPKGKRVAWVAADDMRGVAVRQSEAVAFGNALVERFGGRIIEDRSGPEVMQQSFIEANMTQRAKSRAEAMARLEGMTIEPMAAARGPGHARVALAEALPSTLQPGRRVHPEGLPVKAYEVESRVNESWVLIVAVDEGPASNVPAGTTWVTADGVNPDTEGDPKDPLAGFTDDPAEARTLPKKGRTELVLASEFATWPGKDDAAPVDVDTAPSEE